MNTFLTSRKNGSCLDKRLQSNANVYRLFRPVLVQALSGQIPAITDCNSPQRSDTLPPLPPSNQDAQREDPVLALVHGTEETKASITTGRTAGGLTRAKEDKITLETGNS